ncbi:type IV secretion system protein [Massilia sp. erpn]|uniref:type IV secretion system protein n=1 Tax=Massilia sp. erpn TaxID=2738142 RepID=UPI0021038341|nr:type IV secretion system protein [Massilia sp. erpn]UTY59672.1 hypothetical protein HPQ68_22340 [Massilia sp. erpn]
MKKTVFGSALLMLLTTLPAGMAHSAGQETPPATPLPVSDKDVFNQVQNLVKQSGEMTTAVGNMNTTLKNAVTRNRQMGKLADTKELRMAVDSNKEIDDEIESISKEVQKLRCEKYVDPKQKAKCEKVELSTFNLIKMLRNNLALSKKRGEKIETLFAELNTVGDTNLKEAADLQARIQTEIALLQNEKNMVDMAIVKNEQEVRLYNQLLVQGPEGEGDPNGNRFYMKSK